MAITVNLLKLKMIVTYVPSQCRILGVLRLFLTLLAASFIYCFVSLFSNYSFIFLVFYVYI